MFVGRETAYLLTLLIYWETPRLTLPGAVLRASLVQLKFIAARQNPAKLMVAARTPFGASFFWGGRMMMAFLAAGTLAYVDERCGRIPPRSEQCTGMLEFILVVDNSWSMREHYDGISEFMRRVTDSFELDAQREFSPRVGIITIAGIMWRF